MLDRVFVRTVHPSAQIVDHVGRAVSLEDLSWTTDHDLRRGGYRADEPLLRRVSTVVVLCVLGRRQIEYVRRRRGRHRLCLGCCYVRLRIRSAIRDQRLWFRGLPHTAARAFVRRCGPALFDGRGRACTTARMMAGRVNS